MRALTCLIVVAALGIVPGAAVAFRDQALFAEPAMSGGGGGSFYTGSVGSRGYDCSICHLDAPGRVRLRVSVDPPSLAETGSWVAGTAYRITVRLDGAAGAQTAFVAEVVDAAGAPAGELEPLDATVDRSAAAAVVFGKGSVETSSWTFDWVAPAAGSGLVDLYLAAVDGDGAGGGSGSDLYRDDVAVARLAFREASSAQSSAQRAASYGANGCRAGGQGPPTLAWLIAVGAWRAARRSRRP